MTETAAHATAVLCRAPHVLTFRWFGVGLRSASCCDTATC